MKTFVIVAALGGVLAAGVARAGDLAYPARAPYTVNQPLNAYSWAGPYLGGNIGYGWGDITGSLGKGAVGPPGNFGKPDGVSGGLQAGHNWQTGAMVYGIEGDIQASGSSDTFAPWKFSNPWFGTVRGRVGYAFSNVMFYGTGGLAFGGLRGETFGLSETRSSAGWAVGAGVEFGFAPNWSAKVEYLYVDLSNSRFTITGVQNGYEFGTVRLGVNYHF